MSSTPSSKKEYSGREDDKKTDKYTSGGVQETGIKYFHVGGLQTKYKLACLPIRESEKCQIQGRMSPESQRILAGTKWSESGFVPSFKDTDKILKDVARRTYGKTHGR
ncbi:hypothetical protein L0665_00050 [Methanogenium marinum]|uniref:Uncharacterized protein n=1 Tax=Methanogenium marinum TaxID=348610 RepID=A0A9Q4KTR1_9EURY|nr:hypothetical protein [Methanogenium marinum]MDE4907020.1 hypothetical protein [Methanogenium marinum]